MNTVNLSSSTNLSTDVSSAINEQSILDKAQEELYAKQAAQIQEVCRLRVEAEKAALEEISRLNLVTSLEEREKRLAAIEEAKKADQDRIDEEQAAEKKRIEEIRKLREQALIEEGMTAVAAAEASRRSVERLNAEADRRAEAKRKASARAHEKEENRLKNKKAKDIEADAKKAERIERRKQREKLTEASREKIKGAEGDLFGGNKTLAERGKALKDIWKAGADNNESKGGKIAGGLTALAGSIVNGLSSLAQQLKGTIDQIGGQKGAIDTRLQGSKRATSKYGSYFDQINSNIVGIAGISPLVKQSDIMNNIKSMVESGIAFNVDQRAFLQTIKDKIAATFDANNGVLKRLIRIQQQDTTAARLGMESALNAFLNNMYETTEYLTDVATSIKDSLEEAEALMNAQMATELEFEVQKWMGSLYSVGMSSSGVNAIANVLGKVASGDISGITGDGAGNLLVLAANDANLPIETILKNGLDASNTNKLLNAMVGYLSKIYDETADSRVVQQQLASVFGLKASDLKAAASLAGSRSDVARVNFGYSDMLGKLTDMAGSMYSRTSMGELLGNLSENINYSMAAGIANNPVLYGIYKFAGLLDQMVGGLPLPGVSVFGNMVDLHTSVADLMRAFALSDGIISSIGKMAGATGGGGLSGKKMLTALGITGYTQLTRGKGSNIGGSGYTVSESGGMYAGNTDSSDIKNKTMADANAEKESVASAQDTSNGEPLSTKNLGEARQIVDLLGYVKSIQETTVKIPTMISGLGASMLLSSGASFFHSLANYASGNNILAAADQNTVSGFLEKAGTDANLSSFLSSTGNLLQATAKESSITATNIAKIANSVIIAEGSGEPIQQAMISTNGKLDDIIRLLTTISDAMPKGSQSAGPWNG